MEEATLLKHTKTNKRNKPHKNWLFYCTRSLPFLAILASLRFFCPRFLPDSAAIDLSIVVVVASILSLVTLVQLGTKGLAKTFEHIPEKYNDSLVGFVILALGIYIIVAG